MSDQWLPDIVIGDGHPLFIHAKAFLDSRQLPLCFEARVKWGSFDGSVFGEVVIAVEREGKSPLSIMMTQPGLGEFDIKGTLVKFACGKVYVELDEIGKAILEQIKTPCMEMGL